MHRLHLHRTQSTGKHGQISVPRLVFEPSVLAVRLRDHCFRLLLNFSYQNYVCISVSRSVVDCADYMRGLLSRRKVMHKLQPFYQAERQAWP